MQSQAYSQAVKATVTSTIAKLKAFQVSANQARNLKASNKGILALVEELQADIKAAEASTKKNMWKVWQEVATLAPARSWDVFNQRIEEVLTNWAALLEQAETCLAAFEQTATAETLTKGQEVLTSIGQPATVEAVTEQGVVIAFADGSGKGTLDASKLHPLPVKESEPLVDVVVYLLGNEKGDKGPAISLKHVTRCKDMEAGIVEACKEFEVVEVRRVFVNNVEVSCKEFIAHVFHMSKIESLLKAEGVDFMDEARAVRVLEQTVLPTKNIKLYKEELASRQATAWVLVQVNGMKGINRVRGMGWVPVKLEEAKGYQSLDDVPHLAQSLSESLGYPVEFQRRHHAIEKRNKALLTIEETMSSVREQLAELEAWAETATPQQKNEWVMAHGHAPICYRTWFEGGQLVSAPTRTLEAPGLCLSVGNQLAVQVEAQRGHSVGLRRRMNVVQQDINTCRDVLAKWEATKAE